jgi:hypothetical protein
MSPIAIGRELVLNSSCSVHPICRPPSIRNVPDKALNNEVFPAHSRRGLL